jgi:hypothetical protein
MNFWQDNPPEPWAIYVSISIVSMALGAAVVMCLI